MANSMDNKSIARLRAGHLHVLTMALHRRPEQEVGGIQSPKEIQSSEVLNRCFCYLIFLPSMPKK